MATQNGILLSISSTVLRATIFNLLNFILLNFKLYYLLS
jgi:hypothetical protein